MATKNKKHKKIQKSKKKKTIRERSSLPGLTKRFFSKIKQEYHDIDYIHILNDKDKLLMNNFLEETLGARFNHEGKKVYKSKTKQREIFNENNARARDIYSIARATGRMVDVDPNVVINDWQEQYQTHEDPELVKTEVDLLTFKEYEKLKNSGAYIPMEILAFYDELFNITDLTQDSNNTSNSTKKRGNT